MIDSILQASFGEDRLEIASHLRSIAADLEMVDRFLERNVVSSVMIDNWALARRAVLCLIGNPTGHPDIRNGRSSCTSQLYFLDEKRGIARTYSRWYKLGERVDPEFWNRIAEAKR
jgi:hypothetical protein